MAVSKPAVLGILGAGGKMGMRIGANLRKLPNSIFYIENAEAGIARLTEAGLNPSSPDQALGAVDILIFAVPDVLIGKISQSVVPKLKENATVIMLDPAAAYMNQVSVREGITYTVCHPCHPALFKKQPTDAGYHDHFGGVDGLQDIVITKLAGNEDLYKASWDVVRTMFAPVDQIFDITLEQMAFLEPTAVEVVTTSAVSLVRDAIDILVNEKGVPREAAMSFVLGHVKIELAVMLLGTNPLSDAAMIAMADGIPKILNPNWKNVFKKEELNSVLQKMLAGK